MTTAVNNTVLVYGATGAQAGPVAVRLLEAGAHVRVVTRDPKRASHLRDLGADVVAGDMRNTDDLRAAHAGVDKVVLQIPFLVGDPADIVTFGQNAIDAAREAGVSLLVWNPTGEIPPAETGNRAIDGRIDVANYLRGSGVPSIIIQPTAYLENFLGPWTAPQVADRDTFAYPIPAAARIQFVSHDDVATFVVEALGRPDLAGTELKVCGPDRLGGEEIAACFSRALGRPIDFRPMPATEFGAFFDRMYGPGAGEPVIQFYSAAAQHPDLLSTDIDLSVALHKLPVRLTSMEAWVQRNAAAFTR